MSVRCEGVSLFEMHTSRLESRTLHRQLVAEVSELVKTISLVFVGDNGG